MCHKEERYPHRNRISYQRCIQLTSTCFDLLCIHHTGKCKSTGAGCNALVQSKLRTGVRLKWRKSVIMAGAQLPTQSQMEDNVRQFREFMNQYNKLTEMCFNDCATDFTTRNILTSENTCAMNCLEKYLKMTQRISERFREHQLLSAEDPAAALQGMAPK